MNHLTKTAKPNYKINKQNHRQLCQLVNRVFSTHSKVLVLRLDLGFNKAYGMDINHHYAKDRFTQLRNNMRNNKLFEHLITYAYSLEYAKQKGWHFHTVWFFNGQKVRQDINLGHLIGQYWNNIINRQAGVYHNCNQAKENYTHNVIGMMDHRHLDAIEDLKQYALPYLCKTTPYSEHLNLTDEGGKRIRMFACGQVSNCCQKEK